MGLSTSKLSAFNKLCKIYRKRILNSKKKYFKEIPSSELLFIALYQKTVSRNSDSASFMGLLKSLLALWVLDETKQTWPMFSELKALIHSERFRVIVFQHRAENDKSELEIFTSKHDFTCNKKFRVIVFMYRAKNHNSQLGIHLRMNSEFSENSELSLCPSPQTNPGHNLKEEKPFSQDNNCAQKSSSWNKTGSQKPHP